MSGVFLVVWDKDQILQSTRGGHPHVTLLYTGTLLPCEDLVPVAQRALAMTRMSKLTLCASRIDSFMKKGVEVHYVLLDVEDPTLIKRVRAKLAGDLGMIQASDPTHIDHVTYKTCTTYEAARRHQDEINILLPIEVTITGVTID